MLIESIGTMQTILPSSKGNASLKNDIATSMTSTSTERSKPSETDFPLSTSKLSAPLFTKKAKLQGTKVDVENTELKHTSMIHDIGKVKKIEDMAPGKSNNVVEVEKVGEMLQVQSNRPNNPFLKSLNNQEKKTGEIDNVPSNRPSNPFLKSSVK